MGADPSLQEGGCRAESPELDAACPTAEQP